MTFEQIYHDNKNKVYNLCLHYVQNTEDAEEITQDVFVKVHDSLNEFRHTAKISTWIYRICINTCLDFIKSKKRKKRFAFLSSFLSDQKEKNAGQIDFEHPGVMLEYKELTQHLFILINHLPHSQKTALILHKIEHKPQAEIAAIMNISVKAAESLIQRARTSLALKLKQSKEK